ncbi:hypothetical protein ACFXK0_01560 [Nocardia sp. NPDC059177]|uniref:hypothetical protein n=1 Tax=Nocardia sp. NPDC059177 TaxID=3346759 RepID=UPI0036D03C1D
MPQGTMSACQGIARVDAAVSDQVIGVWAWLRTRVVDGGRERRTIKATEVASGLGFPHACLVLQVQRTITKKGPWHRPVEVVLSPSTKTDPPSVPAPRLE